MAVHPRYADNMPCGQGTTTNKDVTRTIQVNKEVQLMMSCSFDDHVNLRGQWMAQPGQRMAGFLVVEHPMLPQCPVRRPFTPSQTYRLALLPWQVLETPASHRIAVMSVIQRPFKASFNDADITQAITSQSLCGIQRTVAAPANKENR
ncbi:hypothetical protein IMCC3135_32170 [Granulosicoccus antarcticus IMCC3135]|uniref:Uncharacterized protein n=1 Tax=Granulosicoccus antarcticus IMCC3135 TaxID=1192854 RepID=A0A2Z2P4T8_9GAMM|nr:hypothetical protein IMCC3135_32170 [Granulosicoccus antarcticus IMCC3135]